MQNLSFDVTDIDQWLERLEGVTNRGPNEWFALCPAHEDQRPSLSLCQTEDGCLVHCFAGCSYGEILQAVDQLDIRISMVPTVVKGLKTASKSAHALWIELFGFPIEDLDPFFVGGIERHLRLVEDRLLFRWPSSTAEKYRLANPAPSEKGYIWAKDSSHPPLWPEIEEVMSPEIYLTEGESDCIVLRRCGLHAYALTTGGSRAARPRFPKTVIRDLIRRGVKKIYLAFDDDDVGHTTATIVYNQILEMERFLPMDELLEVSILPIADMALSYLGEKDLRQVWLRVRDIEAFAQEFGELKVSSDEEDPRTRLYTVTDYLAKPHTPLSWVVDEAIQVGGLGWISGFPKMGKSWVALDLAFSIATGSKFLGHFDVPLRGDVVYVVKENSDASLISRIEKLSRAKKSTTIHVTKGSTDYVPIDGEPSVMIDASRDFRFEPRLVESLIQKVNRHQKRTGRPVRAIIIDPLSFSLPGGAFDISSFTDFQKSIVDQMSHIIHRTGSAVIVVHHQNKGDNNTMLGSIAAEASFDNKIVFLTKNRGGGEYYPGDPIRLQMVHRDGVSRTYDFEMLMDDDTYNVSLTPVSDDDVRQSTMKVKVSYLDRQKKVVELVQGILEELPSEFTWKVFETAFRAKHSLDEVSSSLFANTFAFMQNPGANEKPLIEQHKRGLYRRVVL